MEIVAAKKPTQKIPDALVYDLMDGKSYYRKGYKSILNKTQTLESIMGCSSLQTAIIEYLMEMFFTFSRHKKYLFLPTSQDFVSIKEITFPGMFVYMREIKSKD